MSDIRDELARHRRILKQLAFERQCSEYGVPLPPYGTSTWLAGASYDNHGTTKCPECECHTLIDTGCPVCGYRNSA